MSLSFDLGKGTSLGLIGPTVFAIGSDANCIVIKQHPAVDASSKAWDRTTTQYFVVTKTTNNDFAERQKLIRGPMTELQFMNVARTENLPPFSKVFKDLE